MVAPEMLSVSPHRIGVCRAIGSAEGQSSTREVYYFETWVSVVQMHWNQRLIWSPYGCDRGFLFSFFSAPVSGVNVESSSDRFHTADLRRNNGKDNKYKSQLAPLLILIYLLPGFSKLQTLPLPSLCRCLWSPKWAPSRELTSRWQSAAAAGDASSGGARGGEEVQRKRGRVAERRGERTAASVHARHDAHTHSTSSN